MKTIYIDGKDFTEDSQFDFKLKYEKTSDLVEGFKYVDKIAVSGEAYDYLNDIFFVQFDKTKVCNIEITPNCCDVSFDLKCGFRNVEKCGCSITITPISNESHQYDALKKTAWFANDFDKNNQNLRVWQCGGSNWLSVVLMLLYNYIIEPLVDIINAIDDILGTGKIDKGPLEQSFTGCLSYHIGYVFREVYEYQCNKIGLTYQSSVFQQGTYKNLAFVPCSNDDGYDLNQKENFNEANAPYYSLLQLHKTKEVPFNLRMWIQENTLFQEPKAVYEKTNIVAIDLDKEDIEGEFCLRYNTEFAYAGANLKYGNDATDSDGNKLANRYNDRVEWNNPVQEWQKGIKEVYAQDFSPVHFMRDGYTSEYSDVLRTQITKRKYDLLLTNFTAQQMKLFLWDGVSPKEDALAVKVKNQGTKTYIYQEALHFNELQQSEELYKNFHASDDPRTFDIIESTDFTYTPKDFCLFAENLKKYGLRCGIKYTFEDGESVIGMAESMEVDFDKQTVKVSKVRWKKPK